MTDREWGEIFNLTEELKRIEEEVDKRLEETLSEDPHEIEKETVHYGAAAAAEDRAEQFRMRQTLPVFGPLGGIAEADTADTMQEGGDTETGTAGVLQGDGTAEAAEDIAASAANETSPAGMYEAMSPQAPDDVAAAAASWNDVEPVGDYVAPRAAEDAEPVPGYDRMQDALQSEAANAGESVADVTGTQYAAPEECQPRPTLPTWDAVAEDAGAFDVTQEPDTPQDSDAVQESDTENRDPDPATIMGSAIHGPVSAFVMGKAAPDASDADRAALTETMQRMADTIATEGIEAVTSMASPQEPMAAERESSVQAAPAEPISGLQENTSSAAESVPGQQEGSQSGQAETDHKAAAAILEPGTPGGKRSGHQGLDRKEPTHAASTGASGQQIMETAGAHRKQILAALVVMIVVLVVLLGRYYYNSQIVPGRQYTEAEALVAAGEYDEAIAAFTAIRGYRDAAEQITAAEYAKAETLADAGSYTEAIDYIDNLSNPTDAILQLRASAIYQIAVQYYEKGDLGAAEGELLLIKDYSSGDDVAIDLLHEIQYQEASDALAVYDYDTAEPILASLGDYADAPILLAQVQNAIDVVYTDVARDDSGKEIQGQTEYLWVHSVITPGAITVAESADTDAESTVQAFRELAGATDNVDDEAVHVLMMHRAVTDAEMTYEDAEPIETDSSTIITKDISSYAAIDDTFGSDQTVYSPQVLQRSNTDYALAFDGSETYAAKDRKDDQVVMECKLADDAYWCKTRRVYAELEDDRFIGVSRHQLRTWTKVLSETLADEVRERFLSNTN